MPNDNAAVVRRFVEDLIVPEAHWSIEQLSRRDNESRMPQDIVQSLGNAPCSERVKKYLVRIGRFVCVEFVEEVMTGMRRIYQLGEFATQHLELRVVEHFDSREVAILAVKVYLLIGEPVSFRVSLRKHITNRRMIA